ncbi:endonuclease domain-containing protein [Pseudactinotalea suaedae]|uniref:endonuclease domain-containing protein n=1 Tax=Pseudactinotalea suaedae TaxID=1524924 RepID=UPI0012E0F672|nr:DUF559 domain-containing protein [Pseudactinotalea suaedae]
MSIAIPHLVRMGENQMSTSAVSRHAAAGRLVQFLPGTYLRRDVVSDPHWRATAVAAWRPDAVIVGAAAAAATFWPEIDVGELEVACRATVHREGLRFLRRDIPPELVTVSGGLRLTHPALTALDLTPVHGGDAIDRVLRSRQARIEDLRGALAATTRRRGNPERRRLLLESRAEPWSAAERLAHRMLHAAGITGWRANVPISLEGHRYFLDVAFTDRKLAVEIDGREVHSLPDVFESDRIRHNALELADWMVLHVTYRMLVENPEYVLTTIRRAITLRDRARGKNSSRIGRHGS